MENIQQSFYEDINKALYANIGKRVRLNTKKDFMQFNLIASVTHSYLVLNHSNIIMGVKLNYINGKYYEGITQ